MLVLLGFVQLGPHRPLGTGMLDLFVCPAHLPCCGCIVCRSLHTKTHKALKSMMGKLQGTEAGRVGAAGGSSSGNKSGHQQGQEASGGAAGVMIDMLESTLWQRQLGSLPEETVGALVAQVRGGGWGDSAAACGSC